MFIFSKFVYFSKTMENRPKKCYNYIGYRCAFAGYTDKQELIYRINLKYKI